ncbi:MAG: hypothetical protein JW734_07370 [Candidatus Omnitrophica bacterium]|nr:hypothetical protein [Candidatus Omnitrophota bacterium]
MKNKNFRRSLIDISVHAGTSVIGAVLIYFFYKNPFYILSFFIGSIFIDLDHFIDYFLYYGFRFNLRKFVGVEYLASGKVYMFIHSWEILIILLSVSLIFRLDYLFFFSIGMSIHLLIDTFHEIRPLFYSIFFRMHKKFNAHVLCPNSVARLSK